MRKLLTTAALTAAAIAIQTQAAWAGVAWK